MVIDPSFADARPTSTRSWFIAAPSITGLNYLNTSEVTDMSHMFAFFKQASLDLSHFITDKVTNMRCMFYGCNSLESLDLSNFNTEKVTDMQQMFYSCENLTSVDLSSFNTAKVTDFS